MNSKNLDAENCTGPGTSRAGAANCDTRLTLTTEDAPILTATRPPVKPAAPDPPGTFAGLLGDLFGPAGGDAAEAALLEHFAASAAVTAVADRPGSPRRVRLWFTTHDGRRGSVTVPGTCLTAADRLDAIRAAARSAAGKGAANV